MSLTLDLKDVCRVCWNASSHKAKPQLSLIHQTGEDKKTKLRVCRVCKHEWKPLSVCKTSVGKFVQIRPIPTTKVREYELCNTFKKGACVKGSACSFAHSPEELQAWSQTKRDELVKLASRPRPHPPPNSPVIGDHKMCMHLSTNGTCPFGMNCYYAHSREEIELWNEHVRREQEEVPRVEPTVNLMIRRRPPLNFNNTYKLCMHVEKGNRCVFGNGCIFAHSVAELEEWNRQLRDAAKQSKLKVVPSNRPPRHTKQRGNDVMPRLLQTDMMSGFPPLTSNDSIEAIPLSRSVTPVWTMSDEVGNDEYDGGTGDPLFVEIVREELANSGIQINELVEMKHGVDISESTNKPLSLTWSREEPVEWCLRITVTDPQMLHNVVLLDARFSEFRICGVDMSTSGKPTKPLLQNCNLMGIALHRRVNPRDYVDIKVLFRPSSGFFTQTVIFKFEGFFIGSVLAVKMLDEAGELVLGNSPPDIAPVIVTDPDVSSRSLFWEEQYEIIPFDVDENDVTTMPDYPLPEDIEEKLRSSAFDNMDKTLTKENYRDKMHQLLYIEEYQQRMDFSRYDIYDEVLQFEKKFDSDDGHIEVANLDEYFVELKLHELLVEGATSIRPNDMALLRPVGQHQAYQCKVHAVMRERVLLRVKESAVVVIQARGSKADIRFTLNRNPMRIMHHALDLVALDVVFPDPNSMKHPAPTQYQETEALRMMDVVLNPNQQLVVRSILQSTYRKLPSLLCGPFGTGKTRTLQEALVLLITNVPDSRVLICTHSNSAADLYVNKVHQVWQERYSCLAPVVRIYYKERNPKTIGTDVLKYCWSENGVLGAPSLSSLENFRVVVTTTMTSYSLVGKIPNGYFTHILVDEAAQAMEAEAVIPLSTATSSTKLVLAGDPMQLEPPVQSDIARKFQLNRSLLERLYDMSVYTTTVAGITCRTSLNENYRSVKEIIDLASSLFYNSELKATRLESSFVNGLAPLRFVGVKGTEEQDEDSPSYYNNFEATEVANQVVEMVSKGLLEEDICVLSPYMKQVQHIRYRLRKKRLSGVSVFRTENVQGLEYKALILSTVRTCTQVPEDIGTESLGFLANPKLFNTAITRAKDYLIVVGDPYTLASVGQNRGCWIEFIGRCRHMKSFVFKDNDAFDRTLEASIQTRHLAQSVPLTSTQQKQASAAHMSLDKEGGGTSLGSRPKALDILRKAPEKARRKVLADRLYPLVRKYNETYAHPITGKLIGLAIEEVFDLLISPELLIRKVQELATELKRDRGQLTSGDGAYNHQTISSQVSPAVSRTEVTVPASNSMQTVVSTPSEPVGPSVTTSTPQGHEQDAVASSGVQTQGQAVIWLLQMQLDCLNEHERQLRAELQRIRSIWPFQSSKEEELLQQQLKLLMQQKAAIQKQYNLYKDYLIQLKTRDEEQDQHQSAPLSTQEMPSVTLAPATLPPPQQPVYSAVQGSMAVSTAVPLLMQQHSVVKPSAASFQVPKLGTSIGQQTGHPSQVPSGVWSMPQQVTLPAVAPYRPTPTTNMQPHMMLHAQRAVSTTIAHPPQAVGHPGAIGTGRQPLIPTNPFMMPNTRYEVPFQYYTPQSPAVRPQFSDSLYSPSGSHQHHQF